MILFAYNQERFVGDAVRSALRQDYPRLEIIASDDGSSDATFDVIRSCVADYRGPHEIVARRNETNRGLADHFNDLVARARGEIIVVAAGDDVSVSRRVSMTVDLFATDPEASIVSFTDVMIDEHGNTKSRPSTREVGGPRPVRLDDHLSGRGPHVSGASRGFRRALFEVFGRLDGACPTEDTPYLLRGLMAGHALVSPEAGIYYRWHGGNVSAPDSIHAMDIGAIRDQYRRDAGLARAKGLVNDETYARILGWADQTYRRRQLAAGFHQSEHRLRYYLSHILPSRDLPLGEKMRMLRTVIS